MVEQRFVAGVVGSALIRIASGFHVEAHRKALQMHDFINRIHDLEVVRTNFGNRQVQDVDHPIFLRFCALLRFCTWRNGKSIRKTSFSCGHCSMCGPFRGGAHGKSIAKAMKGLICGTQLRPRSTPPV